VQLGDQRLQRGSVAALDRLAHRIDEFKIDRAVAVAEDRSRLRPGHVCLIDHAGPAACEHLE
jgi:hypothetical protein